MERSLSITPGGPGGIFSIPDVRHFIAFKVLFNSRFYYPVFTILFLDFGLTVAQFSVLNAVWAATIVLAEVPSGALADILGRKRLLVFAALSMVLEVGVICLAPSGGKVFWFFLINRILSGLAEAAASGADEALAYDALVREGRTCEWGRVLEVTTRCQSIGFILAMTLGAAIYDPELMNRLTGYLGLSTDLAQTDTMRFPLYATFGMALGACWATTRMSDSRLSNASGPCRFTEAFSLTLNASRWIIASPFVLFVMLFSMLFDSTIRMVITLNSQYYRMILLPESLFGVIGAFVSVLGIVVPRIARQIAEKSSPARALTVSCLLTLTGLSLMACFMPRAAGIIPAVMAFAAMYFNGFFTSFYINRESPSDQRATVLSFKGLACNLSYGLFGVAYALVLKTYKASAPALTGQALDNFAFKESFWIFPAVFAAGFVLLLIPALAAVKRYRNP